MAAQGNRTMEMQEAYKVLGLPEGAAEANVRAAYKDLVQVWHPDRFAHNPRLREQAEAKMKEINIAYGLIQSAGFPSGPRTQGENEEAQPDAPTSGEREPPRTEAPAEQVKRRRSPLLRIGVAVALVLSVLLFIGNRWLSGNHLRKPALRWAMSTKAGGDSTCRGIVLCKTMALVYANSRYTEEDAQGSPTGLHYGASWVKAVDSHTGEPIWHREFKHRLAEPCIDDGVVYMGFDDGSLCAARLDTGAPVWEITLEQGVRELLVADGVLCAHSVWTDGASPTQEDPDTDGVCGVDTRAGRVLWHKNVNKWSRVALCPGGRIAVWTLYETDLKASLLDSTSGNETEEVSYCKDVHDVDDIARKCGRVYALSGVPSAGNNLIRAFDTASGRSLWSYKVPEWFMEGLDVMSPSIYEAGSTAYAFYGLGSEGLIAIDTTKCTEMWTARLGAGLSSISSDGGLVGFAGTDDAKGRLFLLNDATGSVKWWMERRTTEVGPVLISGGWVYYGLGDQIVAAELPSKWLSEPVHDATVGAYYESYAGCW